MLDIAEKVLGFASRFGAEYADVRVERVFRTSLRYVNERFEQASSGIERGMGVRVLCSGAWGFASTNSFKEDDLEAAVNRAVKMARATSSGLTEKVSLSPVKTVVDRVVTSVREPLAEVDLDRKMRLVMGAFQAAKSFSSSVVNVSVSYGDATGESVVVTSEETAVTFEPSRTATGIFVVAREGEKITAGFEPVAGVCGYELYEKLDVEHYAKKAAEKAVNMLKAKSPPSGRFTAVVNQTLGGVFAHEAVGHTCEGDYIATKRSILHDKLGKKVGSEHVTIYDDSTYPGGWGTAKYDAEGVPTTKRLLIERGVVKNVILDRESAAKLNREPNGGARAQSFAFRPIVRMSNTYIAPGDFTFEEMIEDIDYGVYVKGSMGGQVDTAKGTFQFAAEEAFLIKKGEVVTPLLNVSLSGLTLETLLNIDAVGKDLKFRPGSCGKEDQLVPTGSGSPHLRIRNAVIGGKA